MYGIQYIRSDDEVTGVKITHKTRLIDLSVELPIDEVLKKAVIEKGISLDDAIQNKCSIAEYVDMLTKNFNLAWADAFEALFGSLYGKALNDFRQFPTTGFSISFDKALEGKVKLDITGIPINCKDRILEIINDNFKICKKEGE